MELGSQVRIDLSDHFSDMDNLSYTATVADSDSARIVLTVDGDDLVVEGLLITTDPVTVTVTAEDSAGQSADQTFKVSVVSQFGVEFPNPSGEEIDDAIDHFIVLLSPDIPPFPAGAEQVSFVYDITPRSANGRVLSEVSATVCLPVGEFQRPGRLSVYYYGADSADWERLPSDLKNAAGTHVCSDVDSFSRFTLGFTVPSSVSDTSLGLLPPTGGTVPGGWIIWLAAVAGVVVLGGGVALGASALSHRRRA